MSLQQASSRKPYTSLNAEESNALPLSSSGERDIDLYVCEISQFKFLQSKRSLRELDNTSPYENDHKTEFEFEQGELTRASHNKPKRVRKRKRRKRKRKRKQGNSEGNSESLELGHDQRERESGSLELCHNEPKCSARSNSREDNPNMVMMEGNGDKEVQKKRRRKKRIGELRRKKKLRKRRRHCHVHAVKRKWSLRHKKQMRKNRAQSTTKKTPTQVEESASIGEQPLEEQPLAYMKMMTLKGLNPAIPLDNNTFTTAVALVSGTSLLYPKSVDKPSLNLTQQLSLRHQALLLDPAHTVLAKVQTQREPEDRGEGCEGEMGGRTSARGEEESGDESDESCISDDFAMTPVQQIEQSGCPQRVCKQPEAGPSEVVMLHSHHLLLPCAHIHQSQGGVERDQSPDRNYLNPFVYYNEAAPQVLVPTPDADDESVSEDEHS